MKSFLPLLFLLFTFLIIGQSTAFAQAIVSGTVYSAKGETAVNASLSVVDHPEKSVTNEDGNYSISAIAAGQYRIRASYTGYKSLTLPLTILPGDSLVKLDFMLISSSFAALNEVVVTGTRSAHRRLSSPVAVNVIDSKTFSITQSNTLSEGLCFSSGLRMETDCQTCNYSQLRMNGLGGSYSQILINSRPVFSSLMSLYGLEQIPANMIDRVEVVKGGGSVLYGSSAIAGTVNIITKQPRKSSFTVSDNYQYIDGQTSDNIFNANVTAVNDTGNAGVSFFASARNRGAYDANEDGYSELPKITNSSFGFNSFLKLSPRDKLELNGWSINEERRGGNKIEQQADKADQSEYRLHAILAGGISYDHFFKNNRNSLTLYASGQNTARKHYTGIDQADAWGHTKNYSLQGGLQYNYTALHFLGGKNTFTTGLEHQYEYTYDRIDLYNYLIDQQVALTGLFAQSEWAISQKFTLLSGLRLNKSNRIDRLITTPRLNAFYKLSQSTQIRATYARGFKAPQSLETDMHIAFSGGGVSVISVDPNLIEETSNSYNLSLDYNKASEKMIYGFTMDGFYTKLFNSFVLEETGTDAAGNQQLMRRNGGSSVVKGITLEGRINYNQLVQLETGFTFQKAAYERPIAWSVDLPGNKRYLRTPNVYGYYTLIFFPQKRFNAVLSGVITGPMLVPHFAGAPGVNADVVNTTQTYLNQNLKLSYRFTLQSIKQDLELSAGLKNAFNQYQSDFDLGKNRDSNYIYGPVSPFSVFVGLKFGLM